MDALVICPESTLHGRVMTLRENATVVAVPARQEAQMVTRANREAPPTRLIELTVQWLRAGSRMYLVLAPYGGGRNPEDIRQVVDMLIDLDPADVQRILVR